MSSVPAELDSESEIEWGVNPLMDQFPVDGPNVRIYRLDPANRSQASFVCRMEAAEYNEEALRDRAGPGLYRADIYDWPATELEKPESSRRVKLRTRRQVAIEALPVRAEAAVSADAPAPGRTPDPALATIERAVALQAQQISALTEAMRQLVQAPRPDTLSHVREFAALIGAVKELMPPPPAPSDRLAEMKSLLDLAEKLGGGGGGGSQLVELAQTALEKLSPLLERVVAAQGQTAAPPPALPPATAGPAPPLPPTPGDMAMRYPIGVIRQYVLALVNAAEQNESIETWAELVQDNLPPATLDQILQDPVAELAHIEPRAASPAVADWIRRLAQAITEDDTGDS